MIRFFTNSASSRFILFFMMMVLLSPILLAQDTITFSSNHNYISSTVVNLPGIKNDLQLNNLSNTFKRVNIQYFDALGRPSMNVQAFAAPDQSDIVSFVTYDAKGRQDKSFLPFSISLNRGRYNINSSTLQASFYSSSNTDVSIPETTKPFSQTVFESSPLDRVLELAFPGETWSVGSGHTVTQQYLTNTAREIKLWNINYSTQGIPIGAVSTSTYEQGTLCKTSAQDENGKSISYTFKDLEGRTVAIMVDDGTTKLITQCIYDDFGNLVYVIPPALIGITAFTEEDTNFTNFIYAYHHDSRQRLSEIKIPGKGWTYHVYDKAGRLILTQDAVQKSQNIWLFTKYDLMGREAYQGIFLTKYSRLQLQTQADAASIFTEDKNNAERFPYYSNRAFPVIEPERVLKIFFYDDYKFLAMASNPNSALFSVPNGSLAKNTQGFLTGTLTKILDKPNMLLTVNYYDKLGKLSRKIKQHQNKGADLYDYKYTFLGELLSRTRKHYNNGNYGVQALTITDTYTYDSQGRNISHTQHIGDRKVVNLLQHVYNSIGRLKQTNIGGKPFSYSYNPRGWVTEVKSPLFTFGLGYDHPDNGAQAQYNGNISSQTWRSSTSTDAGSYHYTYDAFNRITSAIQSKGYTEKGISYDLMGNITSLTRLMDGNALLKYTYEGNRLSHISGAKSFTYSYDENGNITDDGVLKVSYNILNFPKTITNDTTDVSYVYDADGRKLNKKSSDYNRMYIDGIEYIKGKIDFVRNEVGVSRNNNNKFSYEYYVKDHLGNTRLVFDEKGNILQRTDYYAFGKEIKLKAGDNKYLYNGKELQSAFGLYDYGARFYNPETARWLNVDPLAVEMAGWSPYNYTFNNPIRFFDPDGRMAVDMMPLGDYYDAKGNYLGNDGRDDNEVYQLKGTYSRANFENTNADWGGTLNKKCYTELRHESHDLGTVQKVFVTGDAFSDRKIQHLHPAIRMQATDFIKEANKNSSGILIRVVQGFRTYDEQNALYAKGRTAPGSIVTNARGGQSNHNFGLAFDIAGVKNGRLDYNLNWASLSRLGKSIGFEWGGDWKFTDMPHFQNMFGNDLDTLRALPKDKNGFPILKL